MEALGIGAAATATGLANVYAYNREAWSTNIQVRMNRRHQKQSVFLNLSSLFREDVRELVEAAVTRQSNYVTVATLVLGMACAAYTSSAIPATAAEYARTAFECCVGASLLYLVLSVLAALVATHLAVTCRRDVLTQVVRLPIEEMADENEDMMQEETMESFEYQSLNMMFRMPGVHLLRKSEDGSSRAQDSNESADIHWTDRVTDSEAKKIAAWVDRMMQRRQTYLKMFSEKERGWEVMSGYAKFYGWLGISHLLQAHGYYCVAMTMVGYTGDAKAPWRSFTIQLVVTLADSTLIVGLSKFLGMGPGRTACEVILACGGQFCISVAIRSKHHPWAARLCVPLMFFCHFCLNCSGTNKLTKLLNYLSRIPATASHASSRNSSPRSMQSFDTFTSDAGSADTMATLSSRPRACSEQSPERLRWRDERPLIFFGSRMVSFTFLLCTIWATAHSVCAMPSTTLGGTCVKIFGDLYADIGAGQEFWIATAPLANRSSAEAAGNPAPPAAPSAVKSQRRLHDDRKTVLVAARRQKRELEMRVGHLEAALRKERHSRSRSGELLAGALRDLAGRIGEK